MNLFGKMTDMYGQATQDGCFIALCTSSFDQGPPRLFVTQMTDLDTYLLQAPATDCSFLLLIFIGV